MDAKTRLDVACCIVDPTLAVLLGRDVGEINQVELELARYRRDAASVAVRRVVGALSGIDVRTEVSNGVKYDAMMLVERALIERIKSAMMTEAVADLLGEKGEALLGELMLL